MNLNKKEVLELIDHYRKYPILWDSKNKWHFNKKKKHHAWEAVAKAMNIDSEDAKKKMQSLLGSFRREKIRLKENFNSNPHKNVIYQSDWFAFRSFDFLMKDEINDISISEQIRNEINKSLGADSVQSPNYSSSGISSNSIKNESNSSTAYQLRPRKYLKTKRKRLESSGRNEPEDPRIQEAFDLLQQSLNRDNTTILFTEYLAKKIDEFDPRMRSIVIHKINNIIFDAEMEKHTEYLVTESI